MVALDLLLISYSDPVSILNTFFQEYRDGTTSASGKKVQPRVVEDAICLVGQALAAKGTPDIRLNAEGKLDICLRFQYQAYTKENPPPPPNRVKSVPVQILLSIAGMAQASENEKLVVILDMIILAFFPLLRPSEYTGTKSATTLFCLNDVSLQCGATVSNLFTTSEEDLKSSTYCSLEFATQKIAIRGGVIGHGLSGDPLLCSNADLVHRVLYL